MSQLFISHSSRDNFAAKALADWLTAEGFSEIFLDLDPERGIAAGERWERALNQAALRCEAVVFLVSKAWLDSRWCWKEYSLARGKNKSLFAVLIDEALSIGDLPAELTGTWQVVDLVHGVPTRTFRVQLPGGDAEEHIYFAEVGLTRLRAGLTRAGLDPKYFAWPPEGEPNRPPYPGLAALDAPDAGVFFGRDAPLVEAMDKLRGQALGAPPRLYVLLGASGAGKSSFLRAGLMPRLARDDRQFLPVPPLRPERAPIFGDNGLLGALVKAFPAETRASLRALVEGGAEALRPLLRRAAAEAQSRIAAVDATAKAPAIVVAVDQAEELFASEAAVEGTRLLEVLAALAQSDDPGVIVVFAIRSDAYDKLQGARPLADLPQQTQSLPPMPRGEYARVIEGPAERVAAAGGKLKIDPRLTQALLEDLERGGGADVLPLLAFTLEHLFREYGAAGAITREDYEATGGIGGVIERAVKRALQAADADPRIPRDAATREKLLRRGLIPWLAGVDPETRTPRRAIARRDDIPEDARPLIDLLVAERLLRADAGEEIGPGGAARSVATLEPAHEALLRQWGLLKSWLVADFGRLATLEGLKRAARDWDANGRDGAWLAHRASRLADAAALDERPDIAAKLDPLERTYLAECRAKEASEAAAVEFQRKEREEAQERALRDAQNLAAANRSVARRTMIGLLAASVLAVAAAGAAYYGFSQAGIARQQQALAEQRRTEAEAAKATAQQRQTEAEVARATAQQRQAEAEAAKATAEAETRKTAQRSAVLAAGAATSLANEGSTDAALLLLLDGSRWFDDANVPDDIRIAFTNALQKTERASVTLTAPGVRTFELRSGLVLVDDATNDISVVRSSAKPALVRKGSQIDSPVRLIADSPAGATFFILRKNGAIEKVDAERLWVAPVGGFPPPKTIAGPYEAENWLAVPEAGVLVHAFRSEAAKAAGMQLYDLVAERLVEGKIDPELVLDVQYLANKANIRRDVSGKLYFLVRGEKLIPYEMAVAGDAFRLSPVNATQPGVAALIVGNCVATMPPDQQILARKEIADSLNSYNHYACEKFGKTYLLDLVTEGSGGAWDTVKFIMPKSESGPAEVRDLKDEIQSNFGTGLANNPAWVGMDPESGMVAGIVNRDMFAYNRNGFAFGHRLPTPPTAARFLDPRTLIVVEGRTGQLTTFDLRDRVTKARSLSALAPHDFLGKEDPIPTFHHGNCVGYAIPEKQSEQLPDGRTIAYRNPSMTSGKETHELAVSGMGRETVIRLGSRGGCVAISPDWKRMLIMSDGMSWKDVEGLAIYDFDKVLATSSLDGAALTTLPVKSPFSAFFVGSTGDVVTTDFTNKVMRWRFEQGRWRSWEVFHGDNDVDYAEPDEAGDRLIVIEHHVGDQKTGTLYSVKARQTWYDLGSDYKWLGAAFITPTDVATSAHWVWQNSFPLLSLTQLQARAKDNLSPHCRPANPADFHSSKCWPAYLE